MVEIEVKRIRSMNRILRLISMMIYYFVSLKNLRNFSNFVELLSLYVIQQPPALHINEFQFKNKH